MSIESEIKENMIHLLNILPPFDRDLRTLTVCCNTNHCFGTDKELKPILETIINELLDKGKITAGKYTIPRDMNHGFKTIRVYSLNKNQPKT